MQPKELLLFSPENWGQLKTDAQVVEKYIMIFMEQVWLDNHFCGYDLYTVIMIPCLVGEGEIFRYQN